MTIEAHFGRIFEYNKIYPTHMTIEAHFGRILEQTPAVIGTEVVRTSAQEPGLAQVAEQQQDVLPPEHFNTPVR